ncbi:MAG: pentapeptide repeat-containing protein [Maricaulaceae bacterium]|nr:pentapeptide repeat-containing protein [Maricaulaceae bacterium]
MKRLGLVIAAFALAAAPAAAQNAGEIARVQGGASCPGCNLFQADLSYRDLPGLNLSGARLRQADLSLATMNRANFSGADLSVANLFGGRFTSASFRNANLSNATLVGAYFGAADFSGANLSGANLGGAEMERVRGLTQGQLNAACGDAWTRLPAGLRVSPCR